MDRARVAASIARRAVEDYEVDRARIFARLAVRLARRAA